MKSDSALVKDKMADFVNGAGLFNLKMEVHVYVLMDALERGLNVILVMFEEQICSYLVNFGYLIKGSIYYNIQTGVEHKMYKQVDI